MMTNLVSIARNFGRCVGSLRFGEPVRYVYNPLDYAWRPHSAYLESYGSLPREVLMVGMNPGPFGMAQTGVPFGEVGMVRDWLGIHGKVERPAREHPKRPVMGFECPRSEVSGRRLWGWARARFGTPERFFKRCFVANYCPLCFMDAGGRNMTPDKLPAVEREPLFAACDAALVETIRYIRPQVMIGIGAFAEKRIRAALAAMVEDGLPDAGRIRVEKVLHPSPASPAANRGWEAHMDAMWERITTKSTNATSKRLHRLTASS